MRVAMEGLLLEAIEADDGTPCVQLLASADDNIGVGPQQLRLYGAEQLLEVARFLIAASREDVAPPD